MVNVITLKNPISGSDFYVSGDDPKDYFWDIHCTDGSIRIDARPMWIAIPILRRVLGSIPGGIWMYTDVALSFADERVEVVQAALELLLLGETSVTEAELLTDINGVMRAFGVRNAALMESRPQSSQTESPPPISPRPQTSATSLEGPTCPRSPRPRFEVATEASKLAALAHSSLNEQSVICGLCRLEFPISTFESGHLAGQFRQNHFDTCALNHASNTSVSESEGDESNEEQGKGDKADELEDIIQNWTKARAQLTSSTRRTFEEPDIDALRAELKALEDSKLVAKGEKIQCGLCRKVLVVSGARRSFQGKIQYFKKKHYYPNHFPQIASACSSISDPGATSNPESIGQTLALALLFQCRRCDREFKSGLELKSHFQNECDGPKTNPPGGPFQCHLCPQALFDEIDIALDHYKRQHEAHIYQCPRCPILFKTNTKLKYHLNSHKAKTQELSPDEAGLKTCDLCDQTFCNKETLLRHVARIHPEMARLKYKLLNCPVCEQLFLSKTYLDDHMKQHEPRAQFSCDRCGKAYFCKDSLLTHVRRKH
ncbi:zinc finger protein-like [Tigriopus californicus]|uniref:zinc finger protein-like n=1 Tax=Tigriopus californicus TaxID=6832 RepID=UPI0027D9EC7C|nr:zinc finger protein-like [Tigriopus californicus]